MDKTHGSLAGCRESHIIVIFGWVSRIESTNVMAHHLFGKTSMLHNMPTSPTQLASFSLSLISLVRPAASHRARPSSRPPRTARPTPFAHPLAQLRREGPYPRPASHPSLVSHLLAPALPRPSLPSVTSPLPSPLLCPSLFPPPPFSPRRDRSKVNY